MLRCSLSAVTTYTGFLQCHAAAASLAGFRWDGGAVAVAGAAVRVLRTWDDLRAPGDWLVLLPYAFPLAPGRAWDLAGATWLQAEGAEIASIPPPHAGAFAAAWDGAGHAARVRQVQAAIADGLVYELNLACRWEAALEPSPHPDLGLHLALLARDPACHAGLFRGGDGPAVVGNSPELFLEVADGAVRSRPIKGTRERVPGREAAVRAELDASPKERAELAMIVDLVRNDLGRVAVPGSVRVADPGSVVDLPRLHHRIATVEARLRPGTAVADAIAAAFPAGSITGAPKRAAMERIAALEGTDRGHWCGAYGLVRDGACRLAVAIRTAEIAAGRITLRAGGGIVADSDPAAEWHEARAKAQGIAAVLGGAV